jgi:hypothetical protein
MPASPSLWEPLVAAFLATHRSRANLGVHALTTPLGVYALLALLAAASPKLALALALAYWTSLHDRVPRDAWRATGVALAALCAAAVLWTPAPFVALGLLVAAWTGQELAHVLAAEPSLQSTYQGRPGWLRDLALHTYYLLPLVLVAQRRGDWPVVAWLVARDRVLHAHIADEGRRRDMQRIRAWVDDQGPTTRTTTHWWWHDLAPEARAAFLRLADAPEISAMYRDALGPAFAVECVHGMNEVYVTGPEPEATSDTVFYMPHVDGPFALFPGATVYRCMVAISPNRRIVTHFPMSATRPAGGSFRVDEGDVLAFDFNRELHYITAAPSRPDDGLRIVLKLHHVAYPRALPPYGRLLARATTWYDERARRLFLDTIAPSGPRARFLARLVLLTTRASELLERYVGAYNLAWTLALAVLSAAVGDPTPLVAGTSFIHYLMYIGTLPSRDAVAFPRFVRNVVFFKALAIAHLGALYVWHFEVAPLSLALIVVGASLSTAAFRALGTDRTYFGVELGRCPPRRVTTFPYGVVPHPMILGGIVWLLGVHSLAPLRAAWPWLVPVHIGLYLLHLAQEVRERAPAEVRRVSTSVTPPRR